jgi:tripartite-type tricarboxylate transporter receptor subunit TctC
MKFIALLFAFFPFIVSAKPIEVQAYWPFSNVSDQGLMIRKVIDQANTIQNKYKFVFNHRPGAGGSLAVNLMSTDKDLAVLIHTSSFYIRHNLYEENYNLNNFSLVNTICSNQPLGIFSKNIKSIGQLKNRRATIGIIPGSITSLVTKNLIVNNKNFNIVEVPYKSTPEATTDMLGGFIDGSVDFVGAGTLARLPENSVILGITGKTAYKGLPTFKEQGIEGLDNITNSYYIFVKNTMNLELQKEISNIFYSAINSEVQQLCNTSNGSIVKTPFESLKQLHETNINLWKSSTSSLPKIDK